MAIPIPEAGADDSVIFSMHKPLPISECQHAPIRQTAARVAWYAAGGEHTRRAFLWLTVFAEAVDEVHRFLYGLHFFDVFGTRRFVSYDRVRTGSFAVPVGESPIYIVGPTGLQAKVGPDPGW